MALEFQTLSVAFGQGLDKKTDPKTVVQGKMLVLENATFNASNQISKRPGYDALTAKTFVPLSTGSSTLVNPKMVASYNNELVCADSGRFYSYSPSLGAWVDKGPYESIASTQMETSSSSANSDQTYQCSALAGNFLIVSWLQNSPSAGGQAAFAAVIDMTTGAKILPDTAMGTTTATFPRCVVLDPTSATPRFGVAYNNATPNLVIRPITVTGSNTVVIGNPITLVAGGAVQYDIQSVAGGGAAVVYAGNIKTLDTTGAVVLSASGFTGTEANTVTVDQSNGNMWQYGSVTSGGATLTTIYYKVWDSSLSTVLASTSIGTVAGSNNTTLNIVAVSDSTTQQTVVYNVDTGTVPTPYIPTVTKRLTSAGVVTAATFTTASQDIYSKPFYVGTSRYILMLFVEPGITTLQPTIFLYNMDALPAANSVVSGVAVAKTLAGSAPLERGSDGLRGFVSNIIALSSTKYAINSGFLAETIIEGTTSTPIRSSTLLQFDWNNADAYQSLISNGQLLLNGGIVQMYDGNVISELNFNVFPTINTAVGGSVVGNVAALNGYLYFAVLQWTDNQGNLHQSSPSAPHAPNYAGGASDPTQIVVTVQCPVITVKDPLYNKTISLALFRTTNGGSQAYQVAHTPISSDPRSSAAISLTDNISDANLVSGLPLYINGNVLPNDPPPPCMIFNSHTNRVWAVDSTNDNNVWYSKTSQQTVGVSFSGNLLEEIDSKGGGIGGLAELDDKEVIFKKDSRIAILYGDGANDTGAGSTLSAPQFIQTDVGCSVSKSIISQPTGILFKSPKGWYMIDRSAQVSYIGYWVSSFNDQDVTSAIRLPSKTQCIFLTSSGSTLVWDYFQNQWSTYTNHAGQSACIFQGLYTYLRTAGAIYQQNASGTYLDAGTSYQLRAQTAWLRLAAVQGFQRVRKVLQLGDHLSPVSGHAIKISASYDFGAGFIQGFSTPIPYVFPGTGGVFQYREALPIQKCESVTLLIEEVNASAGQTGEFIDLTDLGFEAGMKRGPNKMPASQSVG